MKESISNEDGMEEMDTKTETKTEECESMEGGIRRRKQDRGFAIIRIPPSANVETSRLAQQGTKRPGGDSRLYHHGHIYSEQVAGCLSDFNSANWRIKFPPKAIWRTCSITAITGDPRRGAVYGPPVLVQCRRKIADMCLLYAINTEWLKIMLLGMSLASVALKAMSSSDAVGFLTADVSLQGGRSIESASKC
jgi:hypothetical protein